MLSTWTRKQRELLALEQQEEKKLLQEKLDSLTPKSCEREGLSILSLKLEGTHTGLYGRTVLTLTRGDGKPFPSNGFKVGDEGTVYAPKLQHTSSAEASCVSGVISKMTASHIELVADDGEVDENVLECNPPLRLDMTASEATHKKMLHALNDMEQCSDLPTWRLAHILFNNEEAAAANEGGGGGGGGAWGERRLLGEVKATTIVPINTSLNAPQIQAIEHALGSPHLACIHGPPGTGKTTAVTELILQAVKRGQKVLVCAPSNVAVDNVLEKLVTPRSASAEVPLVVRLGHPARVSAHTQRYCLEALIANDEGSEIVQDVRDEMDKCRKEMSSSSKRIDWSRKRELQAEVRILRKEVRKREEGVVRSILRRSNVVLCTCVGAASKIFGKLGEGGGGGGGAAKGGSTEDFAFDMVVIDEAAQALEAACWIPMLRANKCVLAGDHCQLPPTVKSQVATQQGLADTLFERILEHPYLKQSARMLNIQYRMNELICDWASTSMYEGRLACDEQVRHHDVSQMLIENAKKINAPASASNSATDASSSFSALALPVLLLIDTAGCLMEEDDGGGGGGGGNKSMSHSNVGEAEVVSKHVRRLVQRGVSVSQIGVITPYNGQLEVLRGMLKPDFPLLEIRSVDGFQGGERECIIVSLVRSSERGQVGFLADKRRINVAVTRARRHLAVVCDSETCGRDEFLR